MVTRRALLSRGGGLLLAGAAFAGYSIAVEPNFMLDVTPYRVSPANWPADLNLRIAVISDLHACEPWMPPPRIARIADLANALAPDLIVLLGDFSGGVAFASRSHAGAMGRSALALAGAARRFRRSWQSRLVARRLAARSWRRRGERAARPAPYGREIARKRRAAAIEEWRAVLARGPSRPDGHPRRRRPLARP